MASPSSSSDTGPKYLSIAGFKFSPEFTKAEESLSYEARPDDLFIVTYPKSGTTWVQMIVTRILSPDGSLPQAFRDHGIHACGPFLEKIGKEKTEHFARPCAIKCHLPYDLTPKNPSAKYIYLMRNPKDQCVSYYHFQKGKAHFGIQDMDFSAFFHFWLTGQMLAGDYFSFNKSWWDHRDDDNVLTLLYEDLKSNPEKEIMRIASFMGQEYTERLTADGNKLLDHIVRETGFEATKKQLLSSGMYGKPDPLAENCRHARKGIIGDWRNHFSPEDNKAMEEAFHREFDGTGMEHLWHKHSVFQ